MTPGPYEPCPECGSTEATHDPACPLYYPEGVEYDWVDENDHTGKGSDSDTDYEPSGMGCLEDYTGPDYVGEEEYPGKPTREQLKRLGIVYIPACDNCGGMEGMEKDQILCNQCRPPGP